MRTMLRAGVVLMVVGATTCAVGGDGTFAAAVHFAGGMRDETG